MGDFEDFVVNTLARLPKNASLTLVVGGGTAGFPMEIFGQASRHAFSFQRLPPLEEFLADSRVKHIFTQNYDLKGCERNPMHAPRFGYGGCKPIPKTPSGRSKITPIPLGVDFHTMDEKAKMPSTMKDIGEAVSPCRQASDLKAASTVARPWADRLNCIAITHDPGYPTRRELKAVLSSKEGKGVCTKRVQGNRDKMWKTVVDFKFAFAPSGMGVESHRFWEMLLLGVVPVVVRSSLDDLYDMFPVVFLETWGEVALPNALETWGEKIVDRFGQEPFSNVSVQEPLRLRYWTDLIARTAQA